jgi:oligoribonuclease (3'-5' exoribonuclease)
LKYLSIDLETTGLDIKSCQILQVAAVVEDTELPHRPIEELPFFCCFIDYDEYKGQPFALQMNSWIFKILAGIEKTPHEIYRLEDARGKFEEFVTTHSPSTRAVVAGKNAAGFDVPFLREFGFDAARGFHHRVIDVGSVFIDFSKKVPPALDDVLGEKVTHDALGDARAVIKCLRKKYT